MILLAIFILGMVAPFLFIFGGAAFFLALPAIWAWKSFHVSERWARVPRETRSKIWRGGLLATSSITWVLILARASG